ncbi:MAG TPA: Asp-tRNA(Asn)/Glu-tRNA(Gln) amidotransferase subunit GatB [Flavobacteriales bacterium]|jgi:aspartyl-tRNA(Asn)/glutamyl-tRNA(Gln) amidotransferase subunit B|nr:Asp-tRNA(Asn)/Glu-tRNA(Gln) amidotransferase subunit GatB [Flavobacteriales bacterium]HJN63344.1 Asp-tRNA(Asn)/Glu-tRNA(Gln) amidotransferase subunit GatB [Flavobacteriales bacterium]|tara:strand:+ start:374 stop:1822 length:1449 start_codon:yes stop_codon:yes gene_type:complete
MSINNKYEAVIGLEVHAQLLTKTKAYSSDENIYGATPNTKTSVITLGHPGTLPRANKKVIEYAVKLGIAVGSKIRERNEYARKNYFYADLPKGYQITQDKTPICNGGIIEIKDDNGNNKEIQITRIHMEEDAGKSIHDLDPFNTLIDLNRAGVPLVEIVSEPEIRSANEAYNYINQVRKLVRYLEICDGNMEEGSLRCDANISVRIKGAKEFGTKVEVKNMNSTKNVKNAIEFEIKRQIELIENGGKVLHETRSFNAANNSTITMRHKEEANDYRYFPEPDLQPVIVTEDYIEKIKSTLPPLPKQLFQKFTKEFALSDYDANILVEEKGIALYFNTLCSYTKNYKAAANFVNGSVKSYLNEMATDIADFSINPKQLAQLIALVDTGKVSNTVATSKVFLAMLESDWSAEEIATKNNWIQESDSDALSEFIQQAIAKYPEKVEEYKKGKKGLIGLFMGEVMKLSNGKADPKLCNQMLRVLLDK